MGRVLLDISMSLDGFIAGPRDSIERPPVLLGDGGRRLFEHVGPERIELERTRMIESPGVTHLRYRVVK
jgi:hypothetical protein